MKQFEIGKYYFSCLGNGENKETLLFYIIGHSPKMVRFRQYPKSRINRAKLYIDEKGHEYFYPWDTYPKAPVVRSYNILPILTKENAKTATVVIHPEHGMYAFNYNDQPLSEKGRFASSIGRGPGSRILSEDEFHLWQVYGSREGVQA